MIGRVLEREGIYALFVLGVRIARQFASCLPRWNWLLQFSLQLVWQAKYAINFYFYRPNHLVQFAAFLFSLFIFISASALMHSLLQPACQTLCFSVSPYYQRKKAHLYMKIQKNMAHFFTSPKSALFKI